MSTSLHRALLVLACSAFLLGTPRAHSAPASGALVQVEWLQANLGRGEILLIDASPAQLHAAGHIPGAVNVDVFSFGGRPATAQEMEALIRSWGISAGRKLVVYDQGGTFFATSLAFDLQYHGFPMEDVAILDGGLAKWKAANGDVTRERTPAPPAGTFKVGMLREDIRVRLPEFLTASGDPARHALVEALDPAQHFGAAKFFDRPGHIPNAVMTPPADFFNADKTFKSPEEIRRMFDHLGVQPGQDVLAHCGGGLAASVPYFAAKVLLGYPNVRLYKESQLEWVRDDRGLPLWTYDAPTMLRDKAWLGGWGSAIFRRYGVSRITVIDVRPESAFKPSHVPFAINVPAAVFRQHLDAPGKLAEALGLAGVNVADEAVVVSSGGLNPDSALAYLALERLGQTRVSLYSETLDEWAFAGLPMEKEEDAAKRGAPPALSYPVRARGEPVHGTYPRVYVASGRALPTRLPPGKVIHVPYTELVEANGAPKPAKDLWAVLTKAGLSRYAEIVTVSDDPGEAAANYFILRLMGYPDVRAQAL